MLLRLQLLIWFIVCLCALRANADHYPKAYLDQGPVSGVYNRTASGRRFASFFGIPYGSPPTGKYRFKEARPAGPWIGTFNATSEPPTCLQYDLITYKTSFAVHGEEDCLNINVHTPKLPQKGSDRHLLDVIVFIHPCAFMSSNGFSFTPNFLLEKDVVFVTFNYRVGPLGFLSTEDDVIPGNYGLKDQILALKWIKKNIKAFGGHPDHVTITGLSAGGASVHYHTLSKHSRGLFRSGIAMSGVALNPWAQAENARAKAFRIGEELGCPLGNSKQLLHCLLNRPARQIVSLAKIFQPWLYLPFSPFAPVVERPSPSAFIDRPPVEIIKHGVPNEVPILFTFTAQEGLFPGSEIICIPKNFKTFNREWLWVAPHLLDYNYTIPQNRLDGVSRAIWLKYMGKRNPADPNDVIRAIGDRLFISDIVKSAKLQAKYTKSPVYAYKFSYRGDKSLADEYCGPHNKYGVSHGDDLGYVVPEVFIRAGDTEQDNLMKKRFAEMWTHFAAYGVPKFGSVSEKWPTVKGYLPNFAHLNIISPNSSKIETSKDLGYLQFWDTLGFNENILRKGPHY